jgi:hypothetical protein
MGCVSSIAIGCVRQCKAMRGSAKSLLGYVDKINGYLINLILSVYLYPLALIVSD